MNNEYLFRSNNSVWKKKYVLSMSYEMIDVSDCWRVAPHEALPPK